MVGLFGGASLVVDGVETVGSLADDGTGTVTILSAPSFLVLGGDNTDATYAGVIHGVGGVAKIGTGTQTLSGANTYGNVTSVSGGVLVVANDTALGADVLGTDVSATG